MNEDYLWDKSGEPDPEIQELEQILAALRYQPKPLELPVVRRRNYFVPLAIAATLLVALVAGGLWLKLQRHKVVPPQQAQSVPSVFKEETAKPELVTKPELPERKPVRRHKPVLSKQEREEALAAKQQLMLALRLASEKLKLAQRRTQAPQAPMPSQIKNQHRVG
jgi:hypothetical protein